METQPTREHVLADLRQSICKVTFTKVDGTLRTMYATLIPQHLPDRGEVAVSEGKDEKVRSSPDRVYAWDVEKKDWRCFYLKNITEWSRIEVPLPAI